MSQGCQFIGMKGSPRDAGPGRGGTGESPKGAGPGGSPGVPVQGVLLWSLGRWGQVDEGVAAKLWQIPVELGLLGGPERVPIP